MPMEKMLFKIAWNESTPARLTYLIDNGNIIIHPEDADDDVTGRKELTFAYETEASDLHIIRWLLWFPTDTLSGLTASARREYSQTFSPLNGEPGKQKIRWESSGAL
ncbi:hypothetical protein MFUL124B02_42535 [Myxococcus fulvus 124B02]|nr:hypothetical protein MFUL124B02_42535 [Myxococcus fulvus 124B02]